MPTQNVNLPDFQAKFIQKRIKAGRYKNASEVVRAGLRLLEQHEAENALKLQAMQMAIKEGFSAIDQGHCETLTDQTLDTFMASVSAKAQPTP